MNKFISILFRAIPLAMGLFCFAYGLYIFYYGDNPNRFTAGPVVFFLGSICIALFTTAAIIIRQIVNTYNKTIRYVLPTVGYVTAIITFVIGIIMFSMHGSVDYFVPGHVIAGLGLITACVATAATVSTRFTLIPENSSSSSLDVNPKGWTKRTESFFKILTCAFAAIAWIWSFILLANWNSTPHFVAGSVMGGIACICTSLIALVASILRQERNVYSEKERPAWPRLVLTMGTIATIWGLFIIFFYWGEFRDFVGFILIALGLVCYSISSKVILLAKIWKRNYPLASRIPLIPILTALSALFLSSFIFEQAMYIERLFVPARVIAGLGAICFTLFSIVSVLESGTSKK